ncbi:hypothetical protein ACLOJK_030946 [Asimina triloba]
MGLFIYCFGGGALFLIGTWEALTSFYAHHLPPPSLSPPPPSPRRRRATTTHANPFFSALFLLAVALFSSSAILNSILSALDALRRSDRIAVALQLQSSAAAALFLLYAAVGFLVEFTSLLPLPLSALNLIALFAFGQEFLLFYLQRKDPSGLENRYFDLILVPTGACFVSTLLQMGMPKSPFPPMARGIGLILQGTWLVQMGFSFFTNLMAHGCSLRVKSRGNYTVRCNGHAEYHRSKAIATLQFNCHLAFLVLFVVGAYSLVGQGQSQRSAVDYERYKPLSEELRQFDHQSQFTLTSDEDEEEITMEAADQKPTLPVTAVNGFRAH